MHKSFKNVLMIKVSNLEATPLNDKVWLNSKYLKTKMKPKAGRQVFQTVFHAISNKQASSQA